MNRCLLAIGIIVVLSVLVMTATSETAEAEVVNLPVPYHRQVETWYCAEASLQMVFDYWGEEIPQHDIGDVANEHQVGGTYASDIARAAKFSNLSQAVQGREEGGPELRGYDERSYGYGTFVFQWTGSAEESKRYTQLMDLVRGGYPVILLSWLDVNHDTTHFRVVKGFDTDNGDFIVNDPLLGGNQRFNMTMLVDDLWTYYDRWAMVVIPWSVEVTVPDVLGPGKSFEVSAAVEYPCPVPFNGRDAAYSWPENPAATIDVVPPFTLHPSQERTMAINISRGGDADEVTWTVFAPEIVGLWESKITVLAGGVSKGYAISYGWYSDYMGGVGQGIVECDAIPPDIDEFVLVEGKYLKEPRVTINYSTSDLGSGVQGVRFSLDGGDTWSDWLDPSGSMTMELSAGDGEYYVDMMVRDNVGNSLATGAPLVVDTTPPRIEEFELAGGKKVVTTRTIPVRLRAKDDTMATELIALRLGSASWGPWEPYIEQFDLELPNDGTHVVKVRVRDTLGNVATASSEITMDTTPPYITNFEVADGMVYSQLRKVEVSFSAFDNLGGELEFALSESSVGAPVFDPARTITSGGVITQEWTFGEEGERILILTVRDVAHHVDEAYCTIIVDTSPPHLSMVLNGGMKVTKDTQVPVAVSAIDPTTDVSKARLRIDSNEWGPWSDLDSFRWIDLGPGEGERVVTVQVRDMAGNMAEVSDIIVVDSSVPTATVSFTKMEPGGIVSEDSIIRVEFSEPMDVMSVQVLLMDNASGRLDCDLEWHDPGRVLNITPTRPLARGAHFGLQMEGTDKNGNPMAFSGIVFSTPEAEDTEWDLVLPGDSAVILLIVVFTLAAMVAIGYSVARARR
jgi:hypothetical protein